MQNPGLVSLARSRSVTADEMISDWSSPIFTRVILTVYIYPDIIRPSKRRDADMTETNCFTAFVGAQRLVTGPLADVALAINKATKPAARAPILVLDDAAGRSIDLALRGTDEDILPRLPHRVARSGETTTEST